MDSDRFSNSDTDSSAPPSLPLPKTPPPTKLTTLKDINDNEVLDFSPRHPALKSDDLEVQPTIVKKIEGDSNKPVKPPRNIIQTPPSSQAPPLVKTKEIVAQLEAHQATVEGTQTLPRIHKAIDDDEFLRSVREKEEEERRIKSLTLPSRRPTAIELLAKPSPSMVRRKTEEEDEDIDLKKLRRSVLRASRSREGLTDAKLLVEPPKMASSKGFLHFQLYLGSLSVCSVLFLSSLRICRQQSSAISSILS